MTEFAKEQLAEKVAQGADALADLQNYRSVGTLDYLRANPDTYYAVCFRFISAIESLFDIGQYLLNEKGARAESQRDIPTLLAREGVISEPLSKQFTTMYGFRNRLVHAYGTLDDAKVAEFLSNRLDDISSLLEIAKKSLGR